MVISWFYCWLRRSKQQINRKRVEMIEKNGRGEWISTTGLLLPKQIPCLIEIYEICCAEETECKSVVAR